jgi:hypothetical protein
MMMNQDCIDVAGLKFARPKLCQSIWSCRKAYRVVEKTGFFSYLAIPYKWHAHR